MQKNSFSFLSGVSNVLKEPFAEQIVRRSALMTATKQDIYVVSSLSDLALKIAANCGGFFIEHSWRLATEEFTASFSLVILSCFQEINYFGTITNIQ